jgi:uncharacterized protein YecE (DUF72 family)
MQMIYLGTAGWNYNHWRGPFYPSNVSNELEFYAKYSKLNEINSTFYRIPTETMVRGWYYFTPDDFIFSAKLTRDITHDRKNVLKPNLISEFVSRLKAGLEEKFQIILAQFPPWLKYSPESSNFIATIIDEIKRDFTGKISIEIRHRSWFNPEFSDYIKSNRLTLVQTTSFVYPTEFHSSRRSFHYIRLLGDRKIIPNESLGKIFLDRNTALNEWVSQLIPLSSQYDTIFVLINNRFSGYAINDAISLNKALRREKLEVSGFEKDDKYLKRQMSLKEFL